MDVHTTEVQAAVQQLVVEHGEYAPRELLLATNRLGYEDYRAWRECRLETLDGVLTDGGRRTRAWLEGAQSWAETLGLSPEPAVATDGRMRLGCSTKHSKPDVRGRCEAPPRAEPGSDGHRERIVALKKCAHLSLTGTAARSHFGAVYEAWREAGISQRRLARDLDVAESEVRRMLNPEHSTKTATIDRALRRLGRRVTVDHRRGSVIGFIGARPNGSHGDSGEVHEYEQNARQH